MAKFLLGCFIIVKYTADNPLFFKLLGRFGLLVTEMAVCGWCVVITELAITTYTSLCTGETRGVLSRPCVLIKGICFILSLIELKIKNE